MGINDVTVENAFLLSDDNVLKLIYEKMKTKLFLFFIFLYI